jgi:hypothetical protein
MKNVTIKQVRKLVEQNNCKGNITCDYNNGIYSIIFSESGKLEFTDSATHGKVYRILKFELSYTQVSNFTNTDEHDGIVQAAQLGQNPFKCTILG